jgi:hypothetical protein
MNRLVMCGNFLTEQILNCQAESCSVPVVLVAKLTFGLLVIRRHNILYTYLEHVKCK